MCPPDIQSNADSYANNYQKLLDRVLLLERITQELGAKSTRVEWSKKHTLSTFRRQLKALRKRLGATQVAMASSLNICQNRYNRLETGTADISLYTARRLADLYGCHVEVRMIPYSQAVKDLEKDVIIPDPYHIDSSGCEVELEVLKEALSIGKKELDRREVKADKLGIRGNELHDMQKRKKRMDDELGGGGGGLINGS